MQVNLVVQGKGGCGKSFVASLLTQFYRDRGLDPVCVDTDPVNATFANYPAFGAEHLEIMEGEDINPRQFDTLIERIVGEPKSDRLMVVDNGAATFVPLCSYLAANEVVPFLAEQGHEVRLHTVIAGGAMLDDTFNGFSVLCQTFPKSPVVVWMNAHSGSFERDGNTLEKTAAYKAFAKRVFAQINLPAVKKETFGFDVEAMLSARQTFGEAIADPRYAVMARQRLRMVAREIFGQMERAGL